ncbi:transposase [Methylorubrum rhodesianum]|nr:transposase [Methylorubrum sp. DB1722]MBK3401408.1 transposase [Methylorubrum rhodesianum]
MPSWSAAVGSQTACIAPNSPWQNGCVESCNARRRGELLNDEVFDARREAQIIIESWRRHSDTMRPQGALGYRPPAPEAFVPASTAWPAARAQPLSPAKRPVEQKPTLHESGIWTTASEPIMAGASEEAEVAKPQTCPG